VGGSTAIIGTVCTARASHPSTRKGDVRNLRTALRPAPGLPERARWRYGSAVSNAVRPLALLAVLALVICAASHADTPTRSLQELRRFKAAEARQAVAVDAHHFYAIDNRAIGKYDKRTGERVGGYLEPDGGGIHHLNSGIVLDGRLYCANSNYPGVPMLSSIEIFDTQTLEHVGSHSFGMLSGSATWIDRRDGLWWVGFGNYEGRGGIPGRGTEWTEIALYDDQWRRVGGYGFPVEVIERFAREVAFVEFAGPAVQREGRLEQIRSLTYNDVSADRQVVAAVQAMEAILARHAAGVPNCVVNVNDAAGGLVLYPPGSAEREVLYEGEV